MVRCIPVPESLASKVRIGDSADVKVQATGEHFTGKVTRFTDALDTSTRTMQVEIDANGKSEVLLEESTRVQTTTDIRSPEGMELVRVFLSAARVDESLRGRIDELIKIQKDVGDDEQRISMLRDQMGEFRQRVDELHAQIVTLRVHICRRRSFTGEGFRKDAVVSITHPWPRVQKPAIFPSSDGVPYTGFSILHKSL